MTTMPRRMMGWVRATLGLAVVCAAAACTRGDEAPPVTQAPAFIAQPVSWKAALIAGDDVQDVFSNAVETLRQRLAGYGVAPADIALLRTDAGAGEEAATRRNVQALPARLAGPPSSGCFVFMTSHGVQRGGLILRGARAVFTPDALARLLEAGCGERPTVVVMSGCFSGIYADNPAVRRPNRIILTASRPDRTSFGCSASEQYTYYDRCLIDSLARGTPWTAIARSVSACVANRERSIGALASQPQAFVGSRVAGLRAF
jgi:hypothetical protein